MQGGGGHIHVYTRVNNIEKTNNVQVREAILFDRHTAICLYSFKVYIVNLILTDRTSD